MPVNGPGSVKVHHRSGGGAPASPVTMVRSFAPSNAQLSAPLAAPPTPSVRWSQPPVQSSPSALVPRSFVPGMIGVSGVEVARCNTAFVAPGASPCAPCQPGFPPSGGGGSPIVGTFNLWGVLYYNGDEVTNTLGAPVDGGLYMLAGKVGSGGPPEWHDLLRTEHFWEAPQQFAPEDQARVETVWIVGPDGVLRPGPQPTTPGDTLIFDGTKIAWGAGNSNAQEKVLIHHQTLPVMEFILPHDFGRLPVVSLLDGTGRQMLAQVIPTDTTVEFTFSFNTTFTAILK